MSVSPLTPLDYIAAGYWQDFLAKRPIAGGMVYETELRQCQLDESLDSLQRIDTLLSQVRRDLVKSGAWHEALLLTDERYRSFMVFLAFYAGRVLARQWQRSPHWLGEFELRKRYPKLPLIADDFYQHMAVICHDDITSNVKDTAALFFALEPIGLRLFGHIDRPFVSVQGGQVASGLYQAVSKRLPSKEQLSVSQVDNNAANIKYANNNHDNHDHSIKSDALNTETELLKKPTIQATSVGTLEALQVERENQVEPDKPVRSEKTVVKPALKASPTPELFTQLLIELDEIEVAQSAGQSEYEQACKVLDQFEQHIAKQSKPRAQVAFSKSHLAAKQQALLKLQDAATAGSSSAMLRLAMYELLGEGVIAKRDNADTSAGTEAGVEWVKEAASKNDSRAQRLLSKMYYQGLGVPQDIDNGQYWLKQASENGHAEASSVMSQWQQAQALITTQQQEQHSLKRYQLLFAAIIVVAIVIFIIV